MAYRTGGDRGDRGGAWRETWEHASLGLQIAGCVAVGSLGGYWLDGRFGTEPWLLLIGFAAGVTAAGRAVWRVVKSQQLESDRQGRDDEDVDKR